MAGHLQGDRSLEQRTLGANPSSMSRTLETKIIGRPAKIQKLAMISLKIIITIMVSKTTFQHLGYHFPAQLEKWTASEAGGSLEEQPQCMCGLSPRPLQVRGRRHLREVEAPTPWRAGAGTPRPSSPGCGSCRPHPEPASGRWPPPPAHDTGQPRIPASHALRNRSSQVGWGRSPFSYGTSWANVLRYG